MPERPVIVTARGEPPVVRRCPECGQTGRGARCHHWDAAGARTIPTVPAEPAAGGGGG